MDAQLLYSKVGEEYKKTGAFFCGKCRLIYPDETRANQCCQNYTCKCGKICEQEYYLSCDECSKKKRIEEEKQKFDKAEKIDIKDYNGYLLSDEYASDDFCGYFESYFENHDLSCPMCQGETEPKSCVSSDDKDSYLSCKSCAWNSPSYEVIDEIYYLFAPEYIWGTKFRPLELDLSEILEHATEEHHESVHDYMKGAKELQIAIDNFNELNKTCGTYWESNKLALINIKEYVQKIFSK